MKTAPKKPKLKKRITEAERIANRMSKQCMQIQRSIEGLQHVVFNIHRRVDERVDLILRIDRRVQRILQAPTCPDEMERAAFSAQLRALREKLELLDRRLQRIQSVTAGA